MKMYEYEFTENTIDDYFVTIEILTAERNDLYKECTRLMENPKTKGTKEYKEIRDKLVAHNIAISNLKMILDKKIKEEKDDTKKFRFRRQEK